MNDLAGYLGAKYGGWFDIAKLYGTRWKTDHWHSLPIGGGTGPTVYRISWVKEAGYDRVPDDLDQFLELCRKLHTIGHPCGFSLGHAVGDANGFAEWALWSHNGKVVDEGGKIALESKETITALKYVAELYKVMISGTIAWNDAGNNKAYIAGEIGLTFNGVSIYQVLKNSPDPTLQAMAADTTIRRSHAAWRSAARMTAGPMQAMLFKHSKYPNAAKEYIRFMMEAQQYGPWLANCLGYWSEPLKAYSKMGFWDCRSEAEAIRNAMDTLYYDGYAGRSPPPLRRWSANYTLVDMFASVATGNATPEQAVKGGGKTGGTVPTKGVGSVWGPLAPSSFGKARMDATVHPAITFNPRPEGWVTRLFDNKPFLVALCMLPSAGLLLVFLTYPLGLGLWLSFTDTTIGQPGQWIGLDNFVSLWQGPDVLDGRVADDHVHGGRHDR